MRKIVAERFANELLNSYNNAEELINANANVFGIYSAGLIKSFFAASYPKERYDLFVSEVASKDESMLAAFDYCYVRKNAELFEAILENILSNIDSKESEVVVVSSVKLEAKQLDTIKEKYNAAKITNEINPKIIAGFKIYFENIEYDHSLLTKLIG